MQSEFRPALAYMCRRILHPLVRILVRFGVSAGEFKSIVDSVYAHAGKEYLEHRGGRVSYSRLAVITGINRSVLPAIMAAPREGDFQPRSSTQLHRAARVLAGWHDDRDFQTAAGRPAVLPVNGTRRSFEQLTRRYSGGVYYWTILAELERVGAVKRLGDNRVRTNRRSLSAGGASAESLMTAGEVTGDLMNTLDHNLCSRTHEQLPVKSLVLPVDPRSLPLFRAQVERRADVLLEQVESFLQSHRPEHSTTSPLGDQHQSLTLGTAVFAVLRGEDRNGKERPSAEGTTATGRRKR
jgi:hypothetical protein